MLAILKCREELANQIQGRSCGFSIFRTYISGFGSING